MRFIKYGDKDELNNYVLIEIQIYRLKWIILLSKYGKNVRFNLSYGDIVDLSISIYFLQSR